METIKNDNRPMVCDCGSTRIRTQMNVGSDIDPSGEESQHLDICQDCGKTRLWVERWSFQSDSLLSVPSVHWGKKWSESRFGIDY